MIYDRACPDRHEMKRLSTVTRLTIWNLVIFGVMELIFGTAVWFTLGRNLYDLVDHRIEGQVEDLKRFLRTQSNDIPLDQLHQQVREKFGNQRSGEYLELFLEKGNLVYRSASLQADSPALLAPEQIKRPIARS